MSDPIKGAIIGALITVLGSILIFYLGQFSTEEALEKNTVEALSGYFECVNIDMSYKEALQALYVQSLNQQNENKQLKEQIQELNKEQKNLNNIIITLQEDTERIENNEYLINSAKQYKENGQIKNALSLLLGIKNANSEVAILIDEYQKEFESEIILQVTSLIGEKKYEEAVDIIDDSLKILPNSFLLKEKREEINQLKPQKLMNVMLPYEKRGYAEMLSSPMSMGGDDYYGFMLGDWWQSSYANFNLNAKYNNINITIGHVDGSGDIYATVNIYADDILIDTIEINNQDLPITYSYDIKNVKRLTFERLTGSTSTGFGDIIVQ